MVRSCLYECMWSAIISQSIRLLSYLLTDLLMIILLIDGCWKRRDLFQKNG